MNSNAHFPPGSSLVAYLRDSGGQDQDMSVLQQEAFIRGWAAEHGYIMARVFKDEARSGSTSVGRIAFEEMIHWLREGAKVTGVVVWKFNRLAREFDDSAYFKADLRRRGFEIISLQDNVPSGPEGRLIESIIDWSSQQYLEDLRKDVRRGQRYLAVVHKVYPLGKIPFGYSRQAIIIGKRRNGQDHIGWKLVPDPKTAPLVRLAFELRAAGATYSEINAQVHLFKSKSGYSNMFENPIFTGTFRMSDVVVEDFCQPLIDRAIWEAVQDIQRGWSKRWGFYQPRAATSEFILTGLLKCGICGWPMYGRQSQGPGNSHPYYYYVCKNNQEFAKCDAPYLPKEQIESQVLETLAELVQKPEMLKDIYDELSRQSQAGSSELDAQIAGLKERLANSTAGINRIVAAITDLGHSQALLEQLGKLEQERNDLRTQVVQLEARREKSVPQYVLEEVMVLGAEIADRLLSESHRDRQQMLRSFVKEIRAKRLGGRGAEIEGQIILWPPGEKIGEITVGLV